MRLPKASTLEEVAAAAAEEEEVGAEAAGRVREGGRAPPRRLDGVGARQDGDGDAARREPRAAGAELRAQRLRGGERGGVDGLGDELGDGGARVSVGGGGERLERERRRRSERRGGEGWGGGGGGGEGGRGGGQSGAARRGERGEGPVAEGEELPALLDARHGGGGNVR